MDRLIYADALIHSICRKCNDVNYDEPCEPSDCAFYYAVFNAPTVDAVKVVRCKDCKHWLKDVPGCTEHIGRCRFGNYMVGAAGYCVYGERKTNEAD